MGTGTRPRWRQSQRLCPCLHLSVEVRLVTGANCRSWFIAGLGFSPSPLNFFGNIQVHQMHSDAKFSIISSNFLILLQNWMIKIGLGGAMAPLSLPPSGYTYVTVEGQGILQLMVPWSSGSWTVGQPRYYSVFTDTEVKIDSQWTHCSLQAIIMPKKWCTVAFGEGGIGGANNQVAYITVCYNATNMLSLVISDEGVNQCVACCTSFNHWV